MPPSPIPGWPSNSLLTGFTSQMTCSASCWPRARDRWNLVSDATAASGLGDAEFFFGEVPVIATSGAVHRGDGTIAGSAARLIDGVRHLAELGVQLADVLSAASERPAALLGRQDHGHISVGGRGDLVVLGDGLEVEEVLVAGRSLI